MENVTNFEQQLADIADIYNKVVALRERQKDDGIMIRIFLDEIRSMYGKLLINIRESSVLPDNVKSKLSEIVRWELERAPGREEKISECEKYGDVFTQKYEGDLAENHKLEAPFSIMTEVYNKISSVRERQKDDGIMGRLYLEELLPIYQSLRARVATITILTDGIKEELLSLIDEEIRQAPIREAEILKAEQEYAEEYTKAYNAALARYETLSPLLKLKFAKQLERLKDDWTFKSIEEINSFFVSKKTKRVELPSAPGEDGEH